VVVAAVVVGARVIGASSHTSQVWASNKPLASATVLTAADLVPVEVNLTDSAPHYFSAAATAKSIVGLSLVVPVAAGELVPVSAVTPTKPGRVLVIGVSSDRMPPGIGHGSVIDLYLTSGGAAPNVDSETDLVSAGLTVQSVIAPSGGGLSGASSSRYQIAVLVSAALAGSLVKTLSKGDAVIVLLAGNP